MFIIWLRWLFPFWEGDRELEVRTATYGPGIDQSQHAKSVNHIIKLLIFFWQRNEDNKNDSNKARQNQDGSGKDQDELQNFSVVEQL